VSLSLPVILFDYPLAKIFIGAKIKRPNQNEHGENDYSEPDASPHATFNKAVNFLVA
jgi:hypothetical protein